MTDAERNWTLPDYVQVGETIYVRAGSVVIAAERDKSIATQRTESGFADRLTVRQRKFFNARDAEAFLAAKQKELNAQGFVLSVGAVGR